jgi:hypothetical protein
MKRVLIISFVLVFVISGLVYAQSANFTGTWVLDYAKSDMGSPMAGKMQARKIVLVIKQTANQLSIERSMGDRKETAVFKLDGSESINALPGGGKMSTWMKWSGAALTAKSTSVIGGSNVEVNDVRSLSANGQVMTLLVTRTTPRGVTKQTLIYNKQ